MFSHIMIGTNDLDQSKQFYDTVLGTLGVKPGVVDRHRVFWRTPGGTFSVSKPIDGEPATLANGATFGFKMESPEQADQFYAAALANGAVAVEDPPGWRGGPSGVYLCYFRDLDGHKICGLHRAPKA
ncbi:VOC family protein [Ottowia thiooxydans]|uniref:VOC family protein n=1 Tax=Ottowia thiooxydans TaxID=219182 RepID=UPI000411491F|nr:VOC family protein [Ottowia thiooxydans]